MISGRSLLSFHTHTLSVALAMAVCMQLRQMRCKTFMCMSTTFIAKAQTCDALPASLNAILGQWRCLSHCISYRKETKAKPSSNSAV